MTEQSEFTAIADIGGDDCQPAIPHIEGRLAPSTLRLLDKPLAERFLYVLEPFSIKYPAFKQVESQAKWMIREPIPKRARGRITYGPRGSGKTTLLESIYNDYYVGGRNFKAVKASLEGVRGTRDVYGRILTALKSPVSMSSTVGDREMIVTKILEEAGTRLLLLDELQDILHATKVEQQRSLSAIKYLMNKLHLHVLAFGTEEAKDALMSDPHLQARFSAIALPGWQANTTLADFLSTYERYLPFPRPSALWRSECLEYLAVIGKGSISSIIERIQNAALHALLADEPSISLPRLQTSIERPDQCGLPERGTSSCLDD